MDFEEPEGCEISPRRIDSFFREKIVVLREEWIRSSGRMDSFFGENYIAQPDDLQKVFRKRRPKSRLFPKEFAHIEGETTRRLDPNLTSFFLILRDASTSPREVFWQSSTRAKVE